MTHIAKTPGVLPIRNTSTTLIATNPVLLLGQIGHETDTERYKVGDGETDYVTLGYERFGFKITAVDITLDGNYDQIEVTAANVTITFPSAGGLFTGRDFSVVNSSSGKITLSSASVMGNQGSDTSISVGKGNAPHMKSNGTQWRII